MCDVETYGVAYSSKDLHIKCVHSSSRGAILACLAKENMCSGSSVAQPKQHANSISEQIPWLAPEQYLGPAVRLGQVDDDALPFRLQNRAHTNYIHILGFLRSTRRWLRELVDADSTSLPTGSNGGDEPHQSEIVSRGNRACGSKVGTSPPRKTLAPKREEEECSEGTRE